MKSPIMKMKTVLFLGVILTVICHLKEIAAIKQVCIPNNALGWSFHGTTNGPTRWGERYPSCNTYPKQSPINIITSDTDKSIGPLVTHGYGTPVTDPFVMNVGETVFVGVFPTEEGVDVPNIELGDDKTHRLSYFVFRFGSSSDRGSGHTIDGKRYAMEVSFLHSAIGQQGGDEDSGLSILVDEVESDNPFFDPLLEVLPLVDRSLRATTYNATWNLNDLVPTDPIPVFHYEGALAIPPCNQTAQWFIAKEIQTIGRNQLEVLRKSLSSDENDYDLDCLMMNNYRPVQPLNGRIVYESP